VFAIDERLRGLPAVKEQVVQLYQSLNAPHLAVPGRRAGPATGFVLGLRGPSGFAVFVYLYLPDSGECAVYAPAGGTVAADRYQAEEAEALSFTESMGFMMDNLNFRARPSDEQDSMIRTLAVFQREPPAPSAVTQPLGLGSSASSVRTQGVITLGKLFSAFCLGLVCLSGCAHVGEKERDQAQQQYEMAVVNLVNAPQEAIKEVDDALALNPEFAEAWHLRAILLHKSFNRLDEAKVAYDKALKFKDPFPEARTNLGNLLMDEKRYDDAITQYQQALNEMTNREPWMAHGNMGWAYFKRGDVKQALEHLSTSTTQNPKFCLGYLQLAQIHDSLGAADESCKYVTRYREHCAERADAWQREAICLQNGGQNEKAKVALDTCVEKSKTDDQRDLCKHLREQLK
jgi:type IV pilus assembly protein PilF